MNALDLRPVDTWPRVGIGSRRYLGAKTRLIPFFTEVVDEVIGEVRSFADVMAGTGAVAHGFNAPGRAVLANDLLYSNHLAHRCFLGDTGLDPSELIPHLYALDELAPAAGYVTRHFGGAYFSVENAARIDAIRERIALWAREDVISPAEESVLLTALLYAADRIAHTCGHYDAYRRSPPTREPLSLRLPDFEAATNAGNRVVHRNANALVQEIDADVIYLDPPYNSRQYSDCYHLLENVARWEKPEVFGQAKKMDRRSLKSRYCGKEAARALSELVDAASCRWLLLSYNNMGERGNDRSNARISDEDILGILSRRGEVKTFTRTFNAFTTGLSDHSEGHEERLFVCEMTTAPTRGAAQRTPVAELSQEWG